MADQTVTLRIHADAKGLITGVELAKKETRSLGDEGERAGRKLGGGMAAARAELERTGQLMSQLKGFAIGLGAALASIQTVKALAGMADTWSDLTARVGLSIREHESASDVMARLADISRQTYSSMELTAESYTRNATTLNALNKSTAQQLDFAQALNNALVVSGAKGQQAELVQNALARSMAEGAAKGDDLNLVLNYGSRVAELLAEELGVNVTELRAMAREGQITGDVIFNSLVKNMQTLTDEAASMPATIEDAFVLLRNSVLQAVGVFDQQNTVSESLAEWLIVVADNMGTVITVSVSLATLYGARMVPVLAASAAGWLANTSQVIAYNASLLRLAGTSPAVVASLSAISRALALASAAVPALLALGAAYATVTGLMSAVDRAIERNEETWRGHIGKLREASLALDDINTRLDDVAATQPLPTEIIEQYTQAVIALNEAEQQRQILAQQAANAQARIAASQAGWFDSLGTFLTKITGATIGAEDALENVSQQQREMGGLTDDLTEKLDRAAAAFDRTFGASVQAGIRVVKEELANMVPATDLAGAISNWWSAFQTGATAASARLDEMNQATQNLDNMKARIIAAGTTATRQLEELGAKGSANLKKLASEALEFARANGMSEEQIAALKATFDTSIASVTAYEAAQKKTRQTTDAAAQAAAEYVRNLEKEIAIFGLSEAAVREYELAHTKGLTPAQRAQAKAALDQIAANQKLKIVWDTAAQAAQTLTRGNADLRERIAQQKDALAGLTPAQIAYNAGVREQAVLEAQLALGKEGLTDAMRAELAARLELLKSYADGEEALDAQAESARELESILSRFDDIGMSGLVRDIRLVEDALERGADAAGNAFSVEQIERMKAALEGLRDKEEERNLMLLQSGVSSLQQMAKEGTAAYTALGIAQDIIAYKSAVAAIANQGSGDPYTAFARIAAMIGTMASIGLRVGGHATGIGGSAAQRQATQGTGTVLGDASAKSESIARAVEITASATQQLVGINRGMLHALQNMAAGLSGASTLLTRGAGGAEFGDIGPVQHNLLNRIGIGLTNIITGGLFGSLIESVSTTILGARNKITDTGILIGGGLLSELLTGITVGAYQENQSRSWWFGSTRTSEQVQDLGDDVAVQFQLVLDSIADAVRAGAEALGLDMQAVNAAIAAFEIEEIRISTMDLSAEEAQAELAAVFSSIFDGLAGAVVPFIGQFQRVGEGLGETLVRVATSVQVTQEAVRQLGIALDETDPERLAQISVGLVDLMGGVEEFIAGITGFVSAFAPESHRFSVAQDALTRAFEQFGLAVPESRDAMWDLMEGLDATTESGRQQIAMLLQLTDVSDAYFQMLEDRASRMAAIDASIADGAWQQYLDGLTDSQRAIEETTRYYDDWRESLIANGATSEQLAEVENQRAVAMGRVLAANAEAAAQEQARLEDASHRYADFITGIWRETVQLSDYQSAMMGADNWRTSAIATAHEHARAAGMAGASEQALALIELRASQLRAQALAQLREETQSLVDQLYGARGNDIGTAFTSGLESASNAAADYWEQQRRSAETLQQYLDSMLLGDLSALSPAEQLAEAWSQLNAAVADGDADQATRLADVYLRLLRGHEASGEDYNAGFWSVRELLQGMLDNIGPIPDAAPGGADGSGYITAAGAEQIAAQNRLDLAVQLAQHLDDLAGAVGQTVWELMDSMGVDLRQLTADLGISLQTITGETVLALVNMADLLGTDLLTLTGQLGVSLTDMGAGIRELAEQTGVNLDALTVESVQALGGLANQLGIDLADIATSVGADLGSLADSQSLLNQALQGEIDKLPDDQARALQEYFDNIVAATSEADANEAIDTMAGYINSLDADIREELAPYFDKVFPAKALTDLDYLTSINRQTADMATAMTTANGLLARIADNAMAANSAAGIPSYAVGTGYVPRDGLAMIHQGETIIPAPFAAWMRENGLPVNSGGGDNTVIVAELRNMSARLDRIERATTAGAQQVAATVAKTGEISDRNADASRARHAQAQRRGVTA